MREKKGSPKDDLEKQRKEPMMWSFTCHIADNTFLSFFFFFNFCCWFRFEDLTSPHPLDDAQGFPTQWSSCSTPGFLRLSGPHPLLLCQWPPGLQGPCSFHRRRLLGRRLPCLWLAKKSHLRQGNRTLPWRSCVSYCTASSAMSPWTQRSKPRLIIR